MSVTILLVEDNEAIIMGLEYLLSQEGYQPCTARTLREAEEEIRERTPDLVLLDVSLPDGNGFTFCKEIKKNDNCPVIFLTASEEEADVVRGFDLGAEDYIIKPFRNRELISRIKRVLLRCGKGNILLKCRDIVLNLEEMGFERLPSWQDALERYLKAFYPRGDFSGNMGFVRQFCK